MSKKHIIAFIGLGILIALSGINFFLWWQDHKQLIQITGVVQQIVNLINQNAAQ